MIYLGFSIRNPWWNRRFANLWHRWGDTGIPHKCWEVEIIRGDSLISLSLDISWQRDHAGIAVGLGLLGYEVHAELYDTRHWDHDQDRWRPADEWIA